MSYNVGRSSGTDRKYRVPNYSVTNQTLTGSGSNTQPTPGMVAPPFTGGSAGSPSQMNPTTPPPAQGASPNTSTMPGRGTTSPSTTTPTTPGSGTTPQIIPSPVTTPRITPSTGTRTNPSTGTVASPTTGTTPTPGMGTGTAPMRPGTGTTPTPGMGTTPSHTPYIYGTTPETPSTPPASGSGEPTTKPPVNPQSMNPSGAMMTPGSNSVAPQAPAIVSTPMEGAPQAPITTSPTTGTMPAPQGWVPSGMQPSGPQEVPYYMNPVIPNVSGAMPYMNYPPYQGIPNMYLPNSNTYNVPMGIPLFPLYGYDNSADLDRDVEYMKQLYPKTARIIQKEIDNECDKMEYDGSMMFDEYPDREHLDKLIDHIYDRIKQMEEEPQVEMNSLYFYPPRRNTNYLRDIVSLLLLSEIFNRRRRYRSRRRWF